MKNGNEENENKGERFSRYQESTLFAFHCDEFIEIAMDLRSMTVERITKKGKKDADVEYKREYCN